MATVRGNIPFKITGTSPNKMPPSSMSESARFTNKYSLASSPFAQGGFINTRVTVSSPSFAGDLLYFADA